jgi:hypothetical protein
MVEAPYGAAVARISPSDFRVTLSARRAPTLPHGD